MSPFISLIIKQLPRLIPVVESLVNKTTAKPGQGDERLRDERLIVIEQSLDELIERSQRLEARLRRMTLLAVFATLMAAIGLAVVLLR